MNTMIFDTETSGLPKSYKASPSDVGAWPRIVEIAWVIVDEAQNRVSASEFIIRPDGFQISPGASPVHGMTTQKAQSEGRPLRYVMACFAEDLSDVSHLVAHNIDFDFPVVNCELLRSSVSAGCSVEQLLDAQPFVAAGRNWTLAKAEQLILKDATPTSWVALQIGNRSEGLF